MNKNLYLIYWSSPEKARNKEVLDTIKQNIQSGFFTNIYIFTDENSQKDLSFLAENIVIVQRPLTTYQDIFDYSNKICSSSECLNILANSDILFNNSIFYAKNITDNDFYCLTRYEKNGILHKHDDPYRGSDSQDVWIWKNKCKIQNANFSLGFIGCDNKIAYFAYDSGYNVKNPSLTIKTHHKHEVNVRPGTSSDGKLRLDPPYKLITPTI